VPFPFPCFKSLAVARSTGLLAVSVTISLLLPLPGQFGLDWPPAAAPNPVVSTGPVQVGTSFSPRHATYLGLDWQQSYKQVEALHFKVIRLSAYWDQIDAEGYGQLDWLLSESVASRQPVVVSVGMKGEGWPEFYIPSEFTPTTGDGGDVGTNPNLRAGVLDFLQATVARYRPNTAVVAWQVENEPLNPAGPHRWYIGKDLLSSEVAAVREADPSRPLMVSAFGHFNMLFDTASNRSGFSLGSLLGFESATAESQSLGLLGPKDILGLDIYTDIGYSFLGQDGVSHAGSDWAAKAGHWRGVASSQGKRAWITEAQAEPWESSITGYADPKSTLAADIGTRFDSIRAQGFGTILLWGSEYWLWRADNGDPSWLDAVKGILAENSDAPPVPETLAAP
jgi:hypothetical protein